MNIYRISQEEETGYDTYDAAIVAAESEDEARKIHPDASSYNPGGWIDLEKFKKADIGNYTGWCLSPESVTVELIGEAKAGTESGLILASFNAG